MSSQSSTTPSPSDPSRTSETPITHAEVDLDQATYSDDYLKQCLRDAGERKQEGTEHFRASRWAEALVVYHSALGLLPKRRAQDTVQGKGKGKARDEPDSEPTDATDDASDGESSRAAGSDEPAAEPPAVKELSPLEQECAKMRAVLYANVGACHVKLGEHAEAVKACSEAITDDPGYVKALLRRAQSNEKIGSWSALSSAQEDYSRLLELLPSGSKEARDATRALQALKPRAEAAQKEEVDEMLGKLKGLGNTILGKFGLSTDNFKFEPNGAGGYNMNFAR